MISLKFYSNGRVEQALKPKILSDMINAAVTSAGLTGVFDAVLTISEAGVFKPHPRVYKLATDRFTCAPADITFMSSNRWDVAGGHVFGFNTVWVNRTNAPDEYPDMPADRVINNLRELVGAV